MPATDMVALDQTIVESRRVRLGLTPPEFAAACGHSDNTLRSARFGRPVSLRVARSVARALRCPLKQLLSTPPTVSPATPQNPAA